MPIITLQRRLREVGRIRLGEQTVSNGRKRPTKLSTFRLTSRDRRIIEAAAVRYGGEVREWTAPDGQQWEVITDASEMPVVVPPGDMSFSQWYELWSAGGCQRRCDGVTNVLGDSACICDPESRECNTTTRLNVMLPEVPGFGLWRLESHGYYAAVELAGVVEMCRRASAAGHMLPARLRLEQRQVKRVGSNGKPQTQKFAVPALDLDVSVGQLGQLSAGASTPVAELANDDAALPVASGWSPVPVAELPEAPEQSVADQLDVPRERKPRANAAAPLPSTGLRPRTAAEAAGGEIVDTVERVAAMKRVLAACDGDRDRARGVWQQFFPDDPDAVGRFELDEAVASVSSASAEGEQTTKEASGASDSVADLVDSSPAPDEGALGPTAGEVDEASTATPAEAAAPAEGMDAKLRGRLFALVGEVGPKPLANLSKDANEDLAREWLLDVVEVASGHRPESRADITTHEARKAVAVLEAVAADDGPTLDDFRSGEWTVHVSANGRCTAKPRGRK